MRNHLPMNEWSVNLSQNRLSMLLLPCVPMPEYGNSRNCAAPSAASFTGSVKRRCFGFAPPRAPASSAVASSSTCAAAATDTSVLTAHPVTYIPFVRFVYDEEGRKSSGTNCACAASRDSATRNP